MEVICPNTVKYGIEFRRFLRSVSSFSCQLTPACSLEQLGTEQFLVFEDLPQHVVQQHSFDRHPYKGDEIEIFQQYSYHTTRDLFVNIKYIENKNKDKQL